MKYGKSLGLSIILICLSPILSFSMNGQGDNPLYFGFELFNQSYTSFSEQRSTAPLIAGYPAIISNYSGFGFSFRSGSHDISLEISPSNILSSDNGSGRNLLLSPRKSFYSRYNLDYACYFPLFKSKRLRGQHALNTGILYEDRYLYFDGSIIESTIDINMYIGPRLKFKYHVSDSWTMNLIFDGRFYLPYLNKGRIIVNNRQGSTIYESDYFAFYYQTVLCMNVIKTLNDGNFLELGVKKNDLIGYANSQRLFYIDDLIHFKFDRLYQIYISMNFDFRSLHE